MFLSMMAAMAKHRVIGANNALPWSLPDELKHFRRVTSGKTVIMGRKTFESIGKALPKRRNIVLTKQQGWSALGVEVFHMLPEALHAARNEEEAIIIGGAKLYHQAISLAQKLYLTFIDAEISGDAFFPEWQENEWAEVSSEEHLIDESHPYSFRMVEWTRRH